MQWPNNQTKLSQITKRKEAIKDRIAKTGQKPKAIVRVALDQAGIEARPVWKPMHKQPVYCRTIENGQLKIENLPCGATCQTSATSVAYVNGVSEEIFKVGMCLPAGPCVSDEDVRYIVETVESVLAQTYMNWEIVFMDDSSQDDTLSQMMDYIRDRRIKVSKNVESKGSAASMNSALFGMSVWLRSG